jgi:hypothetical protein
MEININADTIHVKVSTIVRLTEHFTLMTTDGVHDLSVDISADLGNIPKEYHEVFMNVLTSKYLNKVSFGHNPFSLCKPPRKKRWWEFWKDKSLIAQ